MFIVHQPPYQSGNLHFHGTCASTKQLLFGINHDIPMGRTALHLICSMRNCDCLAIPNLERRQPDMSLESLPITSTKLNVYKISSHLATAQVVRHPTYYSVFRQVLTRWQLATKRQSWLKTMQALNQLLKRWTNADKHSEVSVCLRRASLSLDDRRRLSSRCEYTTMQWDS